MRVLLTGGGTMGSVTPLIAIAEEIKKQREDAEFLWLGTKNGPERNVIKEYGIQFNPIVYGKWPRYFSIENFLAPFKVLAGFFQAILIIIKFNPDIILSAGAFVSVPVVWAGWLLRKKSLIHQQDVKPGLANKLMALFANKITVTFDESLKYFNEKKAVLTSNPVRPEILEGDRERAIQKFKLEQNIPTVLFLGGGTGSLKINEVVIKAVPLLVNFCQIIHVTGKNKDNYKGIDNPRYHKYEFLIEEIKDVYAISDLVVSRAGLGTLTELSVLAKPAILVPLPGHQELNAIYYSKNNAAILLEQKELTAESLVRKIKFLLENHVELENLSRNINKMIDKDATKKIVSEIFKLLPK